ncbi:MAG: ABC transporter ATP-binding protein [Acidimicrobiia bacterium]
MNDGCALQFIDVVKSFGRGPTEVQAVRGVSLSVAPGEVVAIMGPSGCGKSTLLHLAGAIETPSSGRVIVDGRDLTELNRREGADLRRREVGFVFQKLNLIASLSAIENVMLPLELDGVSTRVARRSAQNALDAVGLERHLDRFPDDLSGGEQQRVAIARAVVRPRSLVLADEPTGALDSLTGDSIIELLASLPESTGAAVVLVTHEPRYASWADRVVFLRDGVIVDESVAGPVDAAPVTLAPAAS